MKTKYTLLVLLLISINLPKLSAQYIIDFSNPQTYMVSCGDVVPSQWSVKTQTCQLSLPPLVLVASSSMNINYTLKINQSGNLESDDKMIVMHKINSGDWVIDTIVVGNNINSVRLVTGIMHIDVADTVFFKAVANTNASNEFWAIKSGDIEISNLTPIYFPLPVELIQFDALYDQDNRVVNIQWATASESNNDFFTIERMLPDGGFEPIAEIDGAGNSNALISYSFLDAQSLPGINMYRLKQTDFDGKFTYSNVIAVSAEGAKNDITASLTGINENELSLSVFAENSTDLVIQLMDINGKSLNNSVYSLSEGLNNIEIGLNTNDVSSGILFLVLQDGIQYNQTMQLYIQ